MANGDFAEWEEWKDLTDDQREYSLYKTLQSMNARLKMLENKRFVSKLGMTFSGFIGGACAVLGMKFFY